MDDPSRPRDCTDVLQQYFQPLQPYLSELKGKTIGQYLEYMRADPRSSFVTDGPDNRGVIETTFNISNKATVIANQGGEVNTLEIFLVGGGGKVLLDEDQKSIRITNTKGRQIMERELQSGRLRREFTNPATLERFDLTGDTIYFQVTAHTPPADAHVSSTPSRGDRASVNNSHEDPLTRAESSRSTAPGSSQRGHGRRNTSGGPPCRTQ